MKGACLLLLVVSTACVSNVRDRETRTKKTTEIIKVRPSANHRFTWVLREDTTVQATVEIEREGTFSSATKGRVLDSTVLSTVSKKQQQLWLCYRDERFARPQRYPAKWHSKEPESRLPFRTLPPATEPDPTQRPPEEFIEEDEEGDEDASAAP